MCMCQEFSLNVKRASIEELTNNQKFCDGLHKTTVMLNCRSNEVMIISMFNFCFLSIISNSYEIRECFQSKC